MLVLHAVGVAGQVGVWAEESTLPVSSPSRALRSARPHPFAASAETLAQLLGEQPSATTLHLPSHPSSPMDSPELIRVAPRRSTSATPSLLAWTVPIVRLDPACAAERLAGFIDSEIDAYDVRPAASVRQLLDLAGFADDLVDRGRLVPTLQRDAGSEARWRGVLTGPDATAAHALITAMPPAFRAAQPDRSQAALVTEALDALVDARARRSLPTSLLPPRRGRKPARLPVVEAWLEALTGPDARVEATADDLDALAAQLQPWAAATGHDPGPAHLVLRLNDPAEDAGQDPADQRWRVDFLLRSRADPSLLVDAARIWSDDGALGRWLRRPREVLLAELARAQAVYTELEQGLRQAQPSGLELDTDGAAHFLTQSAAALDQAGVEVLLPAWWGKRARIGLRASATPTDAGATPGMLGRDELCDFNWELAVGEHRLSEEEIAALVAAKASLVRVRGEWVSVDPAQLARGLDFLRASGQGRTTAGEFLGLAAGHPDDLGLPLPLTGLSAGGWLGDLLEGTAPATLETVVPPDGFTATLRPYQSRGLSWLDFLSRLGMGACLADDMGLGKTIQLLALEATARARTTPARPTLLLCPVSLIGNWQAEAARFAPGLRVAAHHGPDRPRGEALAAVIDGTDLLITTYATALNDIDELSAIAWERLVLDEAQAIKNRHSRTARAVRLLPAGQRIALTGTPVENRLAELWSIMDVVNPGLLGPAEEFRKRFATPIERHHDEEAAGLLRRITRPYILRRLKTDPTIIDDLPEKIEIRQPYRLTVEQASLYQSVVEEMMARIEDSEGIARRGNVLAAMTKLKQVCNHPAQLLHDHSVIGRRSGKVQRLEEILAEILAEGDRVLCFTQFTEFAELLVPHLAARFDTDVAYLSGSTTRQRRVEMVERFQAGEGAPIFLLSLKAGGTGLNLTAANHVIHLDRWWNPAVENQATDRAFRIGQQRSVQVHKFVGTGTLEERIDQLIEDKKALADLAVGDGESWLTELSTDSLRDLFALSKEAVGE